MLSNHAVVRGRHLHSRPVRDHLPVIEEQHAVAVFLERWKVVTYEHDGLSLALVVLERFETFLLEARISNGEHLIHDEQVGSSEDRD